MNLLKANYISFFVVYFTISLINTFVFLYIPVFMLVILDVNRIELAFIQFLSYLTLFLGPIIGFFFDKFSHMKKKLILISSVFLFFSFLFFNFNIDNLSYFGIFLALNFTSTLIIKAGMSKLMLESSEQKNIKKNIILISNVSASFGSIVPIIMFNFLIYDIDSISLWSLFFNLCWLMSFPILIIFFSIKDKILSVDHKINNTILNPIDQKKKIKIKSNYGMLLTYLTNFLIWSDKLLEFPFISWLLTKFGESGFFTYSYLFFIFTFLYIGGWLISRRLINQYNSRTCLSISIVLYASLMFSLIFSDLTTFLLITAMNKIVSGVMMSQLTERNVNVSKMSKNNALSYEMIRSSSLLASFIFVPLGTLLSSYTPTENLILLVVFMSLFSITPIIKQKLR
jgi:MFS family permease